MTARFRPHKPIPREVGRIARRLIDRCLEHLEACRGTDTDDSVHEVRKSLKRLRALLRLVRREIRPRVYRKEDERFRDVSRRLNEVRDARICVDTIRKLADEAGENGEALLPRPTLDRLESQISAEHGGAQQLEPIIAESLRAMGRARKRVRKWSDVPDRWRTVAKGLKETDQRGAEALAVAAGHTTAENLHQWRKHVRYLRYQLEFLRRIGGPQAGTISDAADELNQLLGTGHDLAILRRALTEGALQVAEADESRAVLALIEKRRSELTRQAFEAGARFFQAGPADLARKVKGDGDVDDQAPAA
jgi:CHAD domain-containing protein